MRTYINSTNFVVTPTHGILPLTVQFEAQVSPVALSYLWDFGDGQQAMGLMVFHTYKSAGPYTVSLTAVFPGYTMKISKTAAVVVANPSNYPADFDGFPTSGPAPLTVLFTGLDNTDQATFHWDFGDGGTADITTPSDGVTNPIVVHIYQNPGIYNVSLTATVIAQEIIYQFIRDNYVNVSAS